MSRLTSVTVCEENCGATIACVIDETEGSRDSKAAARFSLSYSWPPLSILSCFFLVARVHKTSHSCMIVKLFMHDRHAIHAKGGTKQYSCKRRDEARGLLLVHQRNQSHKLINRRSKCCGSIMNHS